MDPITIALIVMGGSAIIKGFGNVFSNKVAREKEKTEAQSQINILKANTAEAVNNLEAQLESNKEQDFIRASAIERGASTEFTQNMQQTYLGQLTAENNYIGQLAQGQTTLGQLKSTEGTSGARSDILVNSIIKQTIEAENKQARQTIDKSLESAVGQGLASYKESEAQANTLRSMYNEGSAYMRLFQTQKQGIINSSAAKESYLQDIYNDASKYDKWDFGADFFGVATPIFEAASSMWAAGAFGPTSNIFGKTK
jgi:uncharacterized protein YecA (UPF0149 family)